MREWKRHGTGDEFHTHPDSPNRKDDDSSLQYNFIQKKEQTLYQSMTKTLRSNMEGKDSKFGNTNDLMSGLIDPQGRSQQKPQRHLSALHSSNNAH